MTNAATEVTFLGAGDCGPVHGPDDGYPIERYTELVRPLLQSVDLRIGNCERQYSSRGTKSEQSPHGCQPPFMAQIFSDCGFDAMSLANNHMYDFGPDALVDTRAELISRGIRPAGAGKNLAEAREPAIVEKNGVKVGLLSYCSIIPKNGEAGDDKPGIAALHTTARAEVRGSHSPARVITEPDPADLAMIIDDIKALRPQVDIVMVAFHWGVIWVPRIISDYQVEVAHACIDAGADMILGHHAHLPKAIEMYKGKAIFYSLSNFCMTKPFPSESWSELPWKHGALRNHADQDPEMPLLPYGKNAQRTLLAKAVLTKEGVKEVSFVPMVINSLYQPEPLKNGDPRFDDMVQFMRWSTEGFPTNMTVRGDEVVLTQAEEPVAAK
ncbi:MAG: CapA family protein [Dehalococcoidia bacterium]